MALAIIGLLLVVVGAIIARINDKIRSFGRPISAFGIILILIGGLLSAVVQVDAGYIGVKKLYGRVQPNVLYSGLHLINPFFDVVMLETRTQNYTMSAVHGEGEKMGDDAIRVLSADGLEVTIDLTVLFRLIPESGPILYRQTGPDYRDKIIRPLARTKIRDNAVYYDAVSLFSSKRDEFQDRITRTLEKELAARGLMLESILIRNISLPASVKSTIESKINAEQEAQKMQFVLQKERQEADRKRVEAQGIADYQRIIGESLTDKQLQYEQIKTMRELAESPNSKIIVMGKGAAPLILDGK